MEKREISPVRAIGNGAWASLAIEPAIRLHGKRAPLAAVQGQDQPDRADGVAGRAVGQQRMYGMAVVGVGFEPVRVVFRVFESVVDAVNLEPDTETIEALVDAFGNGRGEN